MYLDFFFLHMYMKHHESFVCSSFATLFVFFLRKTKKNPIDMRARDGLWTVCVVNHLCLFSSVQSIVSTISINLFHRAPFRKCSSPWNTHTHTFISLSLSTLYSHVFCFSSFYFIVVILMLIVVVLIFVCFSSWRVQSMLHIYIYINIILLSSSFLVHFLFVQKLPLMMSEIDENKLIWKELSSH